MQFSVYIVASGVYALSILLSGLAADVENLDPITYTESFRTFEYAFECRRPNKPDNCTSANDTSQCTVEKACHCCTDILVEELCLYARFSLDLISSQCKPIPLDQAVATAVESAMKSDNGTIYVEYSPPATLPFRQNTPYCTSRLDLPARCLQKMLVLVDTGKCLLKIILDEYGAVPPDTIWNTMKPITNEQYTQFLGLSDHGINCYRHNNNNCDACLSLPLVQDIKENAYQIESAPE
ncbi:uncharacterized protein LOC129592474 isoform X2 [Paramacrobiotus metropolitanus]|uniref:uncharacterized protein LOC129592474 isoform X2 n=1 Tax=Paramacrobiotus metropolitanus TaxID=2943436 RepID=UPI0024460A90|nr:uncharacterized protein LOC129592474 isoform X2 [Paramacrobiotus metropolitanus]